MADTDKPDSSINGGGFEEHTCKCVTDTPTKTYRGRRCPLSACLMNVFAYG
uniref:Uncharacterized protein n=1 Tax=Salix viminalis TaxID=40686 RepID=A0A6N2MYH6_SALVM